MPLTLGQPVYRPRSSTNDLKTIVEENLEFLRDAWDEHFRKKHGPLSRRLIDLFERFTRCGDPHFGFFQLSCPQCDEKKILPFSCKARGLCPSCGKKRALLLGERLAEEVLPRVPYAPVVFTIPKMLRPLFLFDRVLFGEFCRVAYAVVRDHLQKRFSHLGGAVPAMIASPQSFGSLLVWHPHIHALISVGVFDADGVFHQDLDLDFGALEEEFRQTFLLRLLRRGTIDDDRYSLLCSWEHSGFSVFSNRVIAAGNIAALESAIPVPSAPASGKQ